MALSEPAVHGINELRSVHFGPENVLANLSLDFVDGTDLAEVERTVTQLERRIKERFPTIANVFVEVQAQEHHLAAGPAGR